MVLIYDTRQFTVIIRALDMDYKCFHLNLTNNKSFPMCMLTIVVTIVADYQKIVTEGSKSATIDSKFLSSIVAKSIIIQ